jgi:prepilin-type N-terminal cleavage/methylation domain-containing protein
VGIHAPARRRNTEGFTLVELMIVVAIIAIVAAIAVPGLMSARISGNEASAIGSLRAINSAEASFSSGCASGGYAVDLADLAKPPLIGGEAFISPDLSTNAVVKSGYRLSLGADAAAGVTTVGSTTVCSGTVTQPQSSYFGQGSPMTPATGTRYFATNARGTIWESTTAVPNPIVASATVIPAQ